MLDPRAVDIRNVSNQIPSQGDVQNLSTSADTQTGQLPLQHSGHQIQLEAISLRIHHIEGRM